MVRPVLSSSTISTVNVAEIYTKVHEYGGGDIPARAQDLLSYVDVVPFDGAQARLTGELRPATRRAGLSLGDRACLALGIQLGAEVYTTEKIWGELGLSCVVRTIRDHPESVQ